MSNFFWKTVSMLGVLIGLVGLTGCNTFSTPNGVLEIAASALQENNLEKFKETLTGDALNQYGNLNGMERLRERFANFKRVDTRKAIRISEEKIDAHHWRKIDEVEVFGFLTESDNDPGQKLNTAITTCLTELRQERWSKGRVVYRKHTKCLINALH